MRILDLHNIPDDCPPYVYVGRRMAGAHPLNGSPLANPFKLTGKTKEAIADAIQKYRNWLYAKINEGDRDVLHALQAINEDSVLACWCCELEGEACLAKPYCCHAQVIFQTAKSIADGIPLTMEMDSQPSLFE